MVLIDLYSAKMLVKEVVEPVMPEIRETRLLQPINRDLHRCLHRDLQTLAACAETERRRHEPTVGMDVMGDATYAKGYIQMLRDRLTAMDADVGTLCQMCGVRQVESELPCGHAWCAVCLAMMTMAGTVLCAECS